MVYVLRFVLLDVVYTNIHTSYMYHIACYNLSTSLGNIVLSKIFCIDKIQQDTTVCRYLLTASLLYMFRASIATIIRSTKNFYFSLWYRLYYVTVQ